MGDISKDINTTFPNSKVKALLNIIYTAKENLDKKIDEGYFLFDKGALVRKKNDAKR